MQPKIYWIDNLRGIACLMVVMIHTTTWYVTNAHSVSPVTWDIANVLKEGANKQVISSQADSLIKISRIWADFFPANTSNQPI